MSTAQLSEENAALRKELERRDLQIEELTSQLRKAARDLKTLQAQLDRLLRWRFGSKSEKLDAGQLELFLQGEATEPEPEEEKVPVANEAPDAESPEDPIKGRHKKQPRVDPAKYDALARVTKTHELPESERVDALTGRLLVPVGVKVTEELEYEPAKTYIVEHERVLYGLSEQDQADFKEVTAVAPLPPRPIEEGLAGPGLLARIIVAKYVDHLPLHRQESIFARDGLAISRKTMCEWVMRCAWLLAPIARAMRREILACRVVQTDDTEVRCNENAKGAGRRTAWLWTYMSPELSDVVFDFTLGRGHEVVDAWLGPDWHGILLGDGYTGFGTVCRKRGLREAGCWMHARRKFHEAVREAPTDAVRMLTLIAELYAVEDEAKKQGLDPERLLEERRQRSAKTIEEIRLAAEEMKPRYSEGGSLHDALRYLGNQWETLVVFLEEGRLPIDNLACEQAIRPVAVGRRNWLFTASPRGGEAAAIYYSIVLSCKRAGVEPFEYLRDVLVRLCTHPASRVEELIPRRWRELRESGALEPLAS